MCYGQLLVEVVAILDVTTQQQVAEKCQSTKEHNKINKNTRLIMILDN